MVTTNCSRSHSENQLQMMQTKTQKTVLEDGPVKGSDGVTVENCSPKNAFVRTNQFPDSYSLPPVNVMRTLEDAIINETQILVEGINKMNQLVAETNDGEVVDLIDKLRALEKKMSLVFTFFKASLYSLNMWQQDGQYSTPSDDMDEDTNRPPIQ